LDLLPKQRVISSFPHVASAGLSEFALNATDRFSFTKSHADISPYTENAISEEEF
jgi:hypothetical protein